MSNVLKDEKLQKCKVTNNITNNIHTSSEEIINTGEKCEKIMPRFRKLKTNLLVFLKKCLVQEKILEEWKNADVILLFKYRRDFRWAHYPICTNYYPYQPYLCQPTELAVFCWDISTTEYLQSDKPWCFTFYHLLLIFWYFQLFIYSCGTESEKDLYMFTSEADGGFRAWKLECSVQVKQERNFDGHRH